MRDLIDRCAYLAAHGGTPFPQAMGMPLSWLEAYFDSEVHKTATKNAEAEGKLAVAQLNRLDGVIRAINHLGKSLRPR